MNVMKVKRGILFTAVVMFWSFSLGHSQFGAQQEWMSVSTKRANVRKSPEDSSEILWRMWKYMPIEIIAYRGDWRKVKDLDGDTGWMHKATLDSVATVMVKREGAKLRKTRGGKVEWILDRGYALRVFSVRGQWLEVSDLSSASGWILKKDVWGVTSSVVLKQMK